MLVGVLLVLACAVVFFETSLRASGRVGVLVLARDVTAGHVLAAADLRVAQVGAGPQVGSVPAGDAASVVGARVAVPRPAGAVLTRADLGPAKFPPAGKAVVAVALKAGQFPPGLSSGTNVAVLITAPTGATGTAAVGATNQPARLDAVVVSVTVDGAAGSGTSVVALLMDEADATAVGAAAAGTVTLLQLASAAGG